MYELPHTRANRSLEPYGARCLGLLATVQHCAICMAPSLAMQSGGPIPVLRSGSARTRIFEGARYSCSDKAMCS
jgi:hypothetical protein